MNSIISHLVVLVIGVCLGFFVLAKNIRTVQPPVVKTVIKDTCLTQIDTISFISDTSVNLPDIIEEVVPLDTIRYKESNPQPSDTLFTAEGDTVNVYWFSQETPYGNIDHKLTLGYKKVIDSEMTFVPFLHKFIRPIEVRKTIMVEPKQRVITTTKYVPFEQKANQIYLGGGFLWVNDEGRYGPHVAVRTRNDLLLSAGGYFDNDRSPAFLINFYVPLFKFGKKY